MGQIYVYCEGNYLKNTLYKTHAKKNTLYETHTHTHTHKDKTRKAISDICKYTSIGFLLNPKSQNSNTKTCDYINGRTHMHDALPNSYVPKC